MEQGCTCTHMHATPRGLWELVKYIFVCFYEITHKIFTANWYFFFLFLNKFLLTIAGDSTPFSKLEFMCVLRHQREISEVEEGTEERQECCANVRRLLCSTTLKQRNWEGWGLGLCQCCVNVQLWERRVSQWTVTSKQVCFISFCLFTYEWEVCLSGQLDINSVF